MRNIDDVLDFREDISPFLVHLTKKSKDAKAKTVLENIISSGVLINSENKISDARWGCKDVSWKKDKISNLFSAICFTETPLNEIHCLMEIDSRKVQLEPYGLVFIKENLQKKNVSPVLYLNNYGENIEKLIYALGDIVSQESYSSEFHKLFPLLSVKGNKVTPRDSTIKPKGKYDFSWEREWRIPYCYGDFNIDFQKDVFIGLCPDNEIEHFETLVKSKYNYYIPFIDPTRNAKWYAKKLIEQRKKFKLSISVV